MIGATLRERPSRRAEHRFEYCRLPQSPSPQPPFDSRIDRWAENFRLNDACIEGSTAIGRATVDVLRMNDYRRLELRRELVVRGELS